VGRKRKPRLQTEAVIQVYTLFTLFATHYPINTGERQILRERVKQASHLS